MGILAFVFLGIIQGATEFLPISSTGHLIVFESLFRVSSAEFGLVFDVALHLGTLLAVIIYFFNDLKQVFIGILKSFYFFNIKSQEQKLGWLVLISAIPAGIAGFLFEDIVDSAFRSPMLVALMLFSVSLYFIYSERRSKHNRSLSSLSFSDALVLGVAQAISLIPGTSRSGIIISSGMVLGLKRVEAARFAFLMAVPTIAGAALKQLWPFIVSPSSFPKDLQLSFIVGIVAAAISGFLSIKFMMHFLAKFTLISFVIYRYVFGFLIIFLFLLGLVS